MAVTTTAQRTPEVQYLSEPSTTPSLGARARATAARWVESYLSRGFDPRVVVGPRR